MHQLDSSRISYPVHIQVFECGLCNVLQVVIIPRHHHKAQYSHVLGLNKFRLPIQLGGYRNFCPPSVLSTFAEISALSLFYLPWVPW